MERFVTSFKNFYNVFRGDFLTLLYFHDTKNQKLIMNERHFNFIVRNIKFEDGDNNFDKSTLNVVGREK